MRRSALFATAAATLLLSCGRRGARDFSLDVPPFPVPQGSEVQRCYYMKFPAGADVDIGSLDLATEPGSHHFQVYVNDEDLADGSEPCFRVVDFTRWHLVFASQTSSMGWTLPDGVAMRFKAHQQVMIQTHYVNAGPLLTPTGIGGGRLTFHEASNVRTHLGAIFAVNHDIHLPPHQVSSADALCAFDRDVKLAALTGHYHFTGTDFLARKSDGVTLGDPFYEVTGFSDLRFQTWATPDAPDFPAGTGIEWHCDYDNTNDTELTFGARESNHEHCNMFVFFYPAEPQEFRVCLKHDRDGRDGEELTPATDAIDLHP